MSDRSRAAPRIRPGAALLAVLALALLARAATYARVPPRLNPDAFSYLNVARQLRGVAMPRAWDELANLPRHNEAARTPGYPLFLELVFRLDGYRPTPEWFLESMARQRRFEAFHFEFFERAENLRAVQLAQHALGLAATVLAYAIALRWTGSAAWAAAAAALAVGIRPSWVYVYEPSVQTEVLAGTLVLWVVCLLTWAEGRPPARATWALALGVSCAAATLVRPALVAAAPILLLGVRLIGRCRWAAVAAAASIWLAVVGGWVVRNGVRDGYWGLTSVGPHNLASHVRYEPARMTDAPVERYCAVACGTDYGGVPILRGLVVEGGLSYVEASSRLRAQLVWLIVQRPGAYLSSAVAAFVRFWYPQEVALHWEAARTRLVAGLPPGFWTSVVAAYVIATTAVMVGALCVVPVPRSAWLALAATAASAVAVASLVAVPSDDVRSAFPFASLLMISGAATCRSLLDRVRARARLSDDLDVTTQELQDRPPIAAVRALGRPGPPAIDGESLPLGVWRDGRHEMSALGSDGEQE